MASLLSIQNLWARFPGQGTPALRGVCLSLAARETVVLLGPSGAGKTTLLLAVLGLLPAGTVVAGEIWFGRRSLRGLSERAWARLRGGQIGYVPQEGGAALNPLRTPLAHVAEALRRHRRLSRREAREEARRWLRRLGLPPDRARALPDRLSGGERQRVLLAAALAPGPALLLADEPTRHLDRKEARDLQALLTELARTHGLSLLLVTHDLALPRCLGARVLFLVRGRGVLIRPAGRLGAPPLPPLLARFLRADRILAGRGPCPGR